MSESASGDFVAALPMYDWPEARAEIDAAWVLIRRVLHAQGIEAPERLARRNADLPAVPGGIRDGAGTLIAPDPATLYPDELDFAALWRHPRLLFAQTCWGPMELGLRDQVRLVGQPDYSGFEGGEGPSYSSAILMRRGEGEAMPAPAHGMAAIPLERIRGKRFAFNSHDSMSGIIALRRDLALLGQRLDAVPAHVETGGHRASIVAVAEARADFCAIDCRSLALARRFEPRVLELEPVGWTARRPGLPYIAALGAPSYSLADVSEGFSEAVARIAI